MKRESLRLDGLGGIDFRNEEGGNQQQKQDSRKGGDIAGGDGAQQLLIMADHPRHGTRLGVIKLSDREPQKIVQKCARVPKAAKLTGKHALYFVFESKTEDRSLCELEDFVFSRRR
ncbi:MAG: hypothetical protein J6Y63_04375 [Bacteroidales bacterium]|nr:hypothetical protein [Bacteroidales bacterium]